MKKTSKLMAAIFAGQDETKQVETIYGLGVNSNDSSTIVNIANILSGMGHHQKSTALYSKAAKLGSAEGAGQLARAALLGEGMTANMKIAFSNFEAALKAGDKWATVLVAAFSHYGIGTKPDDFKAKELLKNLGTDIDVFCVAESAEKNS